MGPLVSDWQFWCYFVAFTVICFTTAQLVRLQAARRRERLADKAVDLLLRSLHGNASPEDAFDILAGMGYPPVRMAFTEAVLQLKQGDPREVVLTRLADRLPTVEMDILAVVLPEFWNQPSELQAVAERLIEIRSIRRELFDRLRSRSRVARRWGIALLLLSLGVLLGVLMATPNDTVQQLLSDSAGQPLVLAAAVLIVVGSLIAAHALRTVDRAIRT